jgi:transcriptional regulator with XRE-family HTH domain
MLVITCQIRAARSLIRWEQQELAVNSGISISTVRRLESLDGPIPARFDTVEKLQTAFERAGVEFIGNPNPGVQIMKAIRLTNGASDRAGSASTQ